MKINEFTEPLRTYIVTVRVVLKNNSSTVRTSIKAEGPTQAYMMLTRLYGVGNVFSISEIVNESPRTCQIQQEATISAAAMHSKKIGPVQLSCVSENEGTKTLSSSELQVKSLADQAQKLNQQAKLKKAQTGLAKAQEKLRSAANEN